MNIRTGVKISIPAVFIYKSDLLITFKLTCDSQ
jgi:hypothetical protein